MKKSTFLQLIIVAMSAMATTVTGNASVGSNEVFMKSKISEFTGLTVVRISDFFSTIYNMSPGVGDMVNKIFGPAKTLLPSLYGFLTSDKSGFLLDPSKKHTATLTMSQMKSTGWSLLCDFHARGSISISAFKTKALEMGYDPLVVDKFSTKLEKESAEIKKGRPFYVSVTSNNVLEEATV